VIERDAVSGDYATSLYGHDASLIEPPL